MIWETSSALCPTSLLWSHPEKRNWSERDEAATDLQLDDTFNLFQMKEDRVFIEKISYRSKCSTMPNLIRHQLQPFDQATA